MAESVHFDHVDLAVIGGGIVGLAHAYEALNRGLSVALFERDPRPMSGSVRNFGMIWPIGQPPGPALERALLSRTVWEEVAEHVGFWREPLGSLHVAHADDEWAVLEEFAGTAESRGYRVELLSPEGCLRKCPHLATQGLRGGMFSKTEMCVDPREAVAKLFGWLERQPRAIVRPGTLITRVEHPWVIASTGERWQAERVLVCSGADMQTLYPEVYRTSGLAPCKLQMMRTVPQPSGWRLGPMLAGGSTLRHYAAFEGCPTLPRLRERFSNERPLFDRFGIHVMASQHAHNAVTIGDSHVYGDEISPFDASEIDDAVLSYLSTLIQLPDPRIAERWHGVYIKLKRGHEFVAEPSPGVRIANGPGGAGMTLSFGFARSTFDSWQTA